MPTLLETDDYRFFLYSNEGSLHHLPSVFVQKNGAEAEFVISQDEPAAVYLKRSFGFDAGALRDMKFQLEASGALARADWNNAFC